MGSGSRGQQGREGSVADHERRFPWLNPGDRLILLLVFIVLFGLLGFHVALRIGFGRPVPEVEQGAKVESHQVDINKAEAWELQALAGIGEVRANDICRYRKEHGPFKTVDELRNVHGFGAKTLDRLRPHLTIGPAEKADGKDR